MYACLLCVKRIFIHQQKGLYFCFRFWKDRYDILFHGRRATAPISIYLGNKGIITVHHTAQAGRPCTFGVQIYVAISREISKPCAQSSVKPCHSIHCLQIHVSFTTDVRHSLSHQRYKLSHQCQCWGRRPQATPCRTCIRCVFDFHVDLGQYLIFRKHQ